MTDKQETGVFIIWGKGRYLCVPILRDIGTEFEIKKVFEMYWPKQEFAVRLADFTERTCLGAAIRKRNADAANF